VTVEDGAGAARTGFAFGPDIVMASVDAMADGINNLLSQERDDANETVAGSGTEKVAAGGNGAIVGADAVNLE
jgi:hypothetical protein